MSLTLTPDRQKKFLDTYLVSASLADACADIGITMGGLEKARSADPVFDKQITVYKQKKIGIVRRKLWDKVMEGNFSAIQYFLSHLDPEMRQDFQDSKPKEQLPALPKEKVDEYIQQEKRKARSQIS